MAESGCCEFGIPIIRISGRSGSGKTTFILKLLELFPELKIGVIKHSRKSLDAPSAEKDTGKHLFGGAAIVAGLSESNSELFFSSKNPLGFREVVALYRDRVDLILLEGARELNFPTILLGELPAGAIANDVILTLEPKPDISPETFGRVKKCLEEALPRNEVND